MAKVAGVYSPIWYHRATLWVFKLLQLHEVPWDTLSTEYLPLGWVWQYTHQIPRLVKGQLLHEGMLWYLVSSPTSVHHHFHHHPHYWNKLYWSTMANFRFRRTLTFIMSVINNGEPLHASTWAAGLTVHESQTCTSFSLFIFIRGQIQLKPRGWSICRCNNWHRMASWSMHESCRAPNRLYTDVTHGKSQHVSPTQLPRGLSSPHTIPLMQPLIADR